MTNDKQSKLYRASAKIYAIVKWRLFNGCIRLVFSLNLNLCRLPEYCVALALAFVKNITDADALQEALSLSLSVLKDNFVPNLRQFRPCFDVYFYLIQEVLYENTALSLDKRVLRDYHVRERHPSCKEIQLIF